MLFYPALERLRASALVGVRAWACTACVASGASPALLACVAPAAVPRAGLHSWGEPGGRAAAWCTSPYPPFFFFPSRFLSLGPSLWQHMQLHSDIPSFITANLPSPPQILLTTEEQHLCVRSYHNEQTFTSHTKTRMEQRCECSYCIPAFWEIFSFFTKDFPKFYTSSIKMKQGDETNVYKRTLELLLGDLLVKLV